MCFFGELNGYKTRKNRKFQLHLSQWELSIWVQEFKLCFLEAQIVALSIKKELSCLAAFCLIPSVFASTLKNRRESALPQPSGSVAQLVWEEKQVKNSNSLSVILNFSFQSQKEALAGMSEVIIHCKLYGRLPHPLDVTVTLLPQAESACLALCMKSNILKRAWGESDLISILFCYYLLLHYFKLLRGIILQKIISAPGDLCGISHIESSFSGIWR